MHALYLPGYSPENRAAAYELAGQVQGFETSTVVEYPHWKNDDSEPAGFDLDGVCDAVIDAYGGRGGDFTVIGKSMGVNICLRAQTISNAFDPAQVVFVGAAINGHARKSVPVDSWLRGYRTPSLWIQQPEDPALSAEELKEYLKSMNLPDSQLVTVDGNGHDDYDAEAVAGLIGKHVKLG